MAAQLPCDLCEQEAAVVMFNNLVDGSAMTVGALCLPTFFGGAMLGAIGSDAHAGPPTKCQACRRVHERMTTPVAPLTAQPPADDGQAPSEADDSEAAAAP
jgi:hypothetical protein